MAVEYIKRGGGRPIIEGAANGVDPKEIEKLAETSTMMMLAQTEMYEEIYQRNRDIMLAIAEVYETFGGE